MYFKFKKALPKAEVGVLVLGTVSITFLISVFCWTSYTKYVENINFAISETQEMTHFLEERARRTIKATNSILCAFQKRIEMSGLSKILNSKKEWFQFRELTESLPVDSSLWILNPKGELIFSSLSFPSPKANFEHHEYFRMHRDQNKKWYIGPVIKNELTNKYCFTLSRRLNDPRGKMLGILVATIEFDEFVRTLNLMSSKENMSVNWFKTGGQIVFRWPLNDNSSYIDTRDLVLFKNNLYKEHHGFYENYSLKDSEVEIASFRTLEDLGIIVTAGLSKYSILSPWRTHVILGGITTLLACFILGFFTFYAFYNVRRQDIVNEAKSIFLSNMSHEIRSPVNAIIGLAGLLKKLELNSNTQNYVDKIFSISKTLLGIINDLLDYSKIDSGKIILESTAFNLDSLIENVINIISFNSEEKNLNIIFSIEPGLPKVLIGDPLRLEQILLNLCNNAIKFTKKGGVAIKVCLIEKNKDLIKLKFAVKDTGIGITPEQLKIIFLNYSQAHESISRKYGGTGLGLAICQRLVKLLEGDIYVESQIGQGSIFTFTSQFKFENQNVISIPSFEFLKNKKILYFDSSFFILDNLKSLFKTYAIDITFVDSREDVLTELIVSNLADFRNYDLVLLDWNSLGQDPTKVIYFVNILLKLANLRMILMVPNSKFEEIKEKTQDLLISAFVTKPFQDTNLLSAMASAFVTSLSSKTMNLPKTESRMNPIFKNSHALLVEDNEINQLIAQEFLLELGFRVDTANNGQEALEFLEIKGNHYDVVLMDLEMPIMDGFMATQIIRKNPLFQNLPIIAMTAHIFAREKEKCFTFGMNDHISKPIQLDNVIQILNKWIPQNKTDGNIFMNYPTLDQNNLFVSKKAAFESLLKTVGINLEEVLDQTLNNMDLMCKLMLLFAEKHSPDSQLLLQALQENNYQTIAKIAHSLKGAAGNLTAKPITEKADEIERLIYEKSYHSIPVLTTDLSSRINELVEVINTANDQNIFKILSTTSESEAHSTYGA